MFCRLDREQRPITVFPLDFARIARPLAARLLADPANHFAGLGRPLGTGYPQLPRERSDASLPLFKVVAYHFHEARQSRASQLTSKSGRTDRRRECACRLAKSDRRDRFRHASEATARERACPPPE